MEPSGLQAYNPSDAQQSLDRDRNQDEYGTLQEWAQLLWNEALIGNKMENFEFKAQTIEFD